MNSDTKLKSLEIGYRCKLKHAENTLSLYEAEPTTIMYHSILQQKAYIRLLKQFIEDLTK